jgi:hypothetical protein
LEVLQALDGEHHVVGGEVGAVVPLDAAAQVEDPGLGILLLPFRRERREDLELLAARDQRLVDVAVDGVGEQLVLRHRVGREVVALAGPPQGGGLGRNGKRERCNGKDRSLH